MQRLQPVIFPSELFCTLVDLAISAFWRDTGDQVDRLPSDPAAQQLFWLALVEWSLHLHVWLTMALLITQRARRQGEMYPSVPSVCENDVHEETGLLLFNTL